VLGVGGGKQVGWALLSEGVGHALMWSGSAESALDLNPIGYNTSAQATDGITQVGSGGRIGVRGEAHAVMWHGTRDSFVDLHPAGWDTSGAYGVWGDVQVGTLEGHVPCLWRGTRQSMRLLPLPLPLSEGTADGIHGDQIVGSTGGFAITWNVNTMRPTILGLGFALATNGTYQVDVSVFGLGPAGPYTGPRAVRWSGVPGTAFDLHHFLPPGFRESRALGIDENGVIVGWATGPFDILPVAWVPTGGRNDRVWDCVDRGRIVAGTVRFGLRLCCARVS
jgi:hypothetical protein